MNKFLTLIHCHRFVIAGWLQHRQRRGPRHAKSGFSD